MAYVQVPKDLSRVKTKVLLNLTKRQLICFLLAGVTGFPVYLLTKGALGSTLSASIMVIIMLPFFFFAMYEKDGKPLEKILKNIIQAKLVRPQVRIYKTQNIYAAVQDKIHEREVYGIEECDYTKAGKEQKKPRSMQGKCGGR